MVEIVRWHSSSSSALAIARACAVVMVAALPAGLPLPAAAQPANTPAITQMPDGFRDDVEVRIASIHRALDIQPEQEALYRSYADVMRGNAETISNLFQQRAQAPAFTGPARLQWYAELTAAHAEAVRRLIAPFNALYQSLTPVQRAAADRYFEALQQRRLARHGQ